jgi:fructokinase
MLCVPGELVVDLLPAPSAGAGPEGTAPRLGVTSRAALGALPDDELLRVVDDGVLVAAIDCTRAGAEPAARAEPDAARAAR